MDFTDVALTEGVERLRDLQGAAARDVQPVHRAKDRGFVGLHREVVPRLLPSVHFDGHLAVAVGREAARVEALANGLAHGSPGAQALHFRLLVARRPNGTRNRQVGFACEVAPSTRMWCLRMTAKASSRKRTARTRRAAAKAPALVGSRAGRAVADRGDKRFAEVVALIEAARGRAYQAVNAELVTHYWELGGYISRKIASAEWAMAWSRSSRPISRRATPGSAATRARISFGCGSSTRRTARTEKSRRW